MLPHRMSAVGEKRKITEYLLAHEDDSGKARFFTNVGFTKAKWQHFATMLLQHAVENDVAHTRHSTPRQYSLAGTTGRGMGHNGHARRAAA